MADLFISYSRQDQAKVEALAALLEGTGWSVWWDRRITTGSSFDLVIEQALAEARAVIVAWSQHSVGSDWVRAEAAYAVDKKKLVPVRLDEAMPPLRFTNIQTVDLSAWGGGTDFAGCHKLIKDLSQLLGPPPAAGAAVPSAAPASVAAVRGATPTMDVPAVKPAEVPAAPVAAAALPPPRPARHGAMAAAMILAALVLIAAGIGVFALSGGSEHAPPAKSEATAKGATPAQNEATVKSETPAKSEPTAKSETPAQSETTAKSEAPAPAVSSSTPAASSTPAPSASPAAAETPTPIEAPAPVPSSSAAAEPAPTASGTPSAAAPAAAPAPSSATDRDFELAFWKSIRESTIAGDFEAYLAKYPNGEFAAVARNRIAALKPAQVASVAPPAKSGPELDVLEKDMVAVRAVPIHESPEFGARHVGHLSEGEHVHIAGKVRGSNWYAVRIKGDTVAYVAGNGLEDAQSYEARKARAQGAAQGNAPPAGGSATAPVASAGPGKAPAAAGRTSAGAYDGTWRGVVSCGPSPNGRFQAFQSEVRPFAVAGGQIALEADVPGIQNQGAHEVYQGQIAPDGTVNITGRGTNARNGGYFISFMGKVHDGVLDASGNMGLRACTLAYRRQ